MKMLGSKMIETERLILRPTEEQDLKIIFDILSIPEVNKYYLTSKLGKNFEEELPWQMKKLNKAKNEDVFQWSITKKEDNECIGQISVQDGEHSSLEVRDIGWFINPKEQRKGYAFESAKNVIDYMFKDVEIGAIETSSAICNPASYALMEKLGFKKRGNEIKKQKYTFVEDLVDCYLYGITKDEYLNNEKKSSN